MAGAGFNDEQVKEKGDNKQKILELFASKDQVSNNDIQTLLGVSDATATRYLDELERERKIRQVGATGQAVYYERVK